MVLGYLWRFFEPGGLERQRLRHALSATVLHFFLPALAFSLVATARVDATFISIPLTAAVTTLIGMAAGGVVNGFFPKIGPLPRQAKGVLLLAAAFGNVTYLGLPVITEMLGQGQGYVAILYDQLAATPILLTAGVFIAARYGEKNKAASLSHALKRVLKLPPLWAVLTGVAVNLSGAPVPKMVMDAARLMGGAVIPVMIFTVGLALDFGDIKRLPVALPALVLKLFAAPLIAYYAGLEFGVAGDALMAVVIEGAMPVMVLSLVIADELGLDVPLAAMCITVSTVASFFTVPMTMKFIFGV